MGRLEGRTVLITGAASGIPSSGFFYDDGNDGDILARSCERVIRVSDGCVHGGVGETA